MRATINQKRYRAGALGLALAMAGCADRPLDLPLTVGDMAIGEAVPDLARVGPVMDLAARDLAVRDLAVSDLAAAPDLARRDLSTRDLALPPDLLPPPICEMVMVSTLAGNGTFGFVDGSGAANGTTELAHPTGVAFDGAGNVIVGDQFNERIRKIAPDGTTTTLAGNGQHGFADGPGSTAQFSFPAGVAVDQAGFVYVAEFDGSRIRKVAPDGTTSTLAGNGNNGFVDGTGGPNGATQFYNPAGVAVDGVGFVYVADAQNERIRKVAPDGTTTTLTGNGTLGFVDGTGGPNGSTQFFYPAGVTRDGAGTVYVADTSGARIRKVAPDGTTTTLAGNGTPGYVDGSGGASGTTELHFPVGMAVDSAGNVYVADHDNNSIRKIAPDGTTVTLAGSATPGFADGRGCDARFNGPIGVALSGKLLVVADETGERIRRIQLP